MTSGIGSGGEIGCQNPLLILQPPGTAIPRPDSPYYQHNTNSPVASPFTGRYYRPHLSSDPDHVPCSFRKQNRVRQDRVVWGRLMTWPRQVGSREKTAPGQPTSGGTETECVIAPHADVTALIQRSFQEACLCADAWCGRGVREGDKSEGKGSGKEG